MSDSSFAALYVVRESGMPRVFGEEISALLTGRVIPRSGGRTVQDHGEGAQRILPISSPNAWFQSAMKSLAELSGLQGLAFLSGEQFTHEHSTATEHDGRVVFRERMGYTVLNDRCEDIIAQISQLDEWLFANWEAASVVLETRPPQAQKAHASAFFSLDPNNEGIGDGEGPEFVFCVLRTLTEILRCAKYHQSWVVYQTTLGVSYC